MTNNFPAMPSEWFPEGGIVVVAKDGDNELGFAITRKEYFLGSWTAQIEPSLLGLRQALWQYRNMSAEEREQYSLPLKEQENVTPAEV